MLCEYAHICLRFHELPSILDIYNEDNYLLLVDVMDSPEWVHAQYLVYTNILHQYVSFAVTTIAERDVHTLPAIWCHCVSLDTL